MRGEGRETLANHWRPRVFEDIVGEEITVEILKRQIENKTFRNCYLFCGVKGCGKTSVARIFANTINKGQGSPIEIDCATNNGVDGIRQLNIEAQQTSLESEYKVIILDEAQCLTNVAWSSALKLIEEPPLNTIFIFCTTNPEKIPDTILSRVQRFDFTRVETNLVVERLEYILKQEEKKYDIESLNKIAVLSNGSLRDALTILDKCLSYSDDVVLENINKVLGITNNTLLFTLTKNIIDKNYENSIRIIEEIKQQTTNGTLIIDDWIQFLIEGTKIQKTKSIKYSNISEEYFDYFSKTETNLMTLIDKILKYRVLTDKIDNYTLLNIILIELCQV